LRSGFGFCEAIGEGCLGLGVTNCDRYWIFKSQNPKIFSLDFASLVLSRTSFKAEIKTKQ